MSDDAIEEINSSHNYGGWN